MNRKRFTAVLTVTVSALTFSVLPAQQAKNVVLSDFVSTEELYQRSTPFPYSQQMSLADIWGWSYNGQEYALVCLLSRFETGTGLSIVRVTDPNNVERIKTVSRGAPDSSAAIDVRVFGNHAYVCQDRADLNSWYVDLVQALSSVGDPRAGLSNFPSSASTIGKRVHNLHINSGNGLLFLSDLAEANRPIPVYDINSTVPSFKGNIPEPTGGRSHDLSATNSRIYDASNAAGLTITKYSYSSGTLAVGSQYNHRYNNRRGTPPNDFTPPLSPSNIDEIAHDAVPSTNGFHLFSTDERYGDDTDEGSNNRQIAAHLKIWDINPDSSAPDGNGFRYPIEKVYEVRECGLCQPTGQFADVSFNDLVTGDFSNSIHNVHIRNENGSDIAYISYYTKGLRILNVANPLNPSEIGYYDVPNVSPFVFPVFAGSWGVYPYFASSTIVVSDARGLYVFRRATEKSGTISSNTTWSGGIFVTGNITVNSPAILTIQPGTTVAFADGKSLTVNSGARIIADGTPTQSIKFTSKTHPPARSKWGGLNIYSTGNVFDNCTFEYGGQTLKFVNAGATVTACTFHTCYQPVRSERSNVFLTNCDISNSFAGITLVGQNGNSATVYINNCHVWKNDRDGITATSYAHAVIRNSHFELNGTSHNSTYHGVYAAVSCDLTFYDPEVVPSSGLNTIRNNEGAGVYSSNSTINIGTGSSPLNKRGDNAIFGNGIYSGTYNGKQIHNAGPSTVNARYTYWGQGNCPPPASFFTGSVDRANCLTTSPTPFSKFLAGSDSINTHTRKDHVMVLRNYLLDQAGLPADVDSLSPYDALNEYFSIIRGDFADTLGERKEVETVLSYLQEKNASNVVGDKAFQYQVGFKMIYGDFSGAEVLCEKGMSSLAKEGQRDMLSTLVSLEIMQGKFSEAEEHFKEYTSDYPDEKAEILLMEEMLASAEQDYELGYKRGFGKPTVAEPSLHVTSGAQPYQFVVSQNFPNPFNPSTGIHYNLPDRGQVVIRIYNVLGVEVRALVNETREAGAYQVFWDGKDNNGLDVASGVYLYRVSFASAEAPSQLLTQNGKMSLLR